MVSLCKLSRSHHPLTLHLLVSPQGRLFHQLLVTNAMVVEQLVVVVVVQIEVIKLHVPADRFGVFL